MLFANFWRRNRAFFKLAVISQLEYRLNYFTDAILQPTATGLIELTLWLAVFKGSGQTLINGYPFASYMAYAIWAAFLARITSTWMYEFRMIDEVDSGSINSVLVRPMTFFEYYFSQFFGYKLSTTAISLLVPVTLSLVLGLSIHWERLGTALLAVVYYLFVVQTLSFIVATSAFHFNRVHALTVAKNLALWVFTGELVPLDLFPPELYKLFMHLPFANAVYIPVGYLTGRFGMEIVMQGVWNSTLALLVLAPIAAGAWRLGIRRYAGTGA